MPGDIYEEAVVDAKKLREKTAQVVEQQLLEKFRPKIDSYIEQALLEADDDDDDNEDILLGVDIADDVESTTTSNVDGEDIARDVEASIEGGVGGEEAALQVNTDGTVTLDLDKMVVPTDEEQQAAAATMDDDMPDDVQTGERQTLVAADVKESLEKLSAIKQLAESVEDKHAAYDRLTTAYHNAVNKLVPSDLMEVDRKKVIGLTELAEHINEAYVDVRESNIDDDAKADLLEKFEVAYARVNSALSEAVCARLMKKLRKLHENVRQSRMLSESVRRKRGVKLYNEVGGLCNILDAVADRTDPVKVGRLKDKITTVVQEIKTMTRRLNEEEVMLKLDLPDDEAKDDVLDALDGDGGDGGESDELDLDLDMGDDSDDDDKVEESSAARDLARLFESDDDDDDGSESLVDLDMGDDNEEGDDDDLDLDMDMGGGDDAASMLDAVADAVRGIEGDVELEVVDDMDDMDDDNEVQLDIDISTDDGEEGVDLDLEESDEMTYEVDMSEVARALKEMDTGYHKHDLPGPGKGLDDFADADEDGEKFVDGEDMGPVAESRRRRRRRGKNLREGTTRSNRRGSRFPTAREVATMRRQLAEAKRKQRDNNLLSAKLLYTNKLLQRSDLTEAHRTRITDAMDEAGNLREARLLYKNITRALDKRKRRGSLSEGRHRPVGSASQVTTSGGFNRESVATNDNPLLNESIDMDLWKRHAGLD